MTLFKDRQDAGRRLAGLIDPLSYVDPVVFGIARGGVVLAKEIAEAHGIGMDVLILKKLGAPGNPELAIGAVVSKDLYYLNEEMILRLGISSEYVKAEIARKTVEINRRRELYYQKADHQLDIKGRDVIVVDDGIATGATVMMAVIALRKSEPRSITLAVPVAPTDTLKKCESLVDTLICPHPEEIFYAVGAFYEEFDQVSDNEVVSLLNTKSSKRL